MTKTRQQGIALFLLISILVFLQWRQAQQSERINKSQLPLETEAGGFVTIDESIIFKKFSYNAPKRDPLLSPIEALPVQEAAPSAAETLPQEFFVQGMFWGVNRPACIINGKVYSVGDEIEGARILEINKEGILLMSQGKTFTVTPNKGGKR